MGCKPEFTMRKAALTSPCCHVVMEGPELASPTDSSPDCGQTSIPAKCGWIHGGAL